MCGALEQLTFLVLDIPIPGLYVDGGSLVVYTVCRGGRYMYLYIIHVNIYA